MTVLVIVQNIIIQATWKGKDDVKMVDDLSVEALKEEMDRRIWKNQNFFSTEKPWYYYVTLFTVDEDATISVGRNKVKITSICGSGNGKITISDCETCLGKLEGADIKKTAVAEELQKSLKIVSEMVEVVPIEQIKSVWKQMVGRLEMEHYAEPNHPSWWIK